MVEVGKIGDKTLVLDGRYISIFRGRRLINRWAYMGYLLPDGNAYIYRRKVHIKELSGNTLTDYQIKIVLGAGDPIFAHARSAGEDIRFCYYPEENMIPHWIEKFDPDAEEAIIWVKVPSIPANSKIEIYMYYGNPTVASASDGDATFEFFDDFEEAELDASKWDETRTGGGITLSNSIITLKDGARIDGKTTLGLSVLAEFKATFSAWDSSSGQISVGFRGEFEDTSTTDANAVYIYAYNGRTYFRLVSRKDGTGSAIDTNKEADNAEHIFRVIRVSESKVKAQIDDLSPVEKTDNIPTTDIPITLETRPSYSETLQVDWVLVRKYASPEPSVSVGAEE